MSGRWLSFDPGVWQLLLIFSLALRFSHRGRGTLLQQPKRVPRKGRLNGLLRWVEGQRQKQNRCHCVSDELIHVHRFFFLVFALPFCLLNSSLLVE